MDYSKQLLLHGAIQGLYAALAGIPYGIAINKKNSAAEARWKLVHSAVSMGAILLIALAGTIQKFESGYTDIIFYCSLIAAYGFLIGMTLAAITGNRGLQSGGPKSNRVVQTLYQFASISTIIFFAFMIFGALN